MQDNTLIRTFEQEDQRVLKLCRQIELTDTRTFMERESLFADLLYAANPHLIAENKTLYSTLIENGPMAEMARSARIDAQQLLDSLSRLDDMSRRAPDWISEFSAWSSLYENHILVDKALFEEFNRNPMSDKRVGDLIKRYNHEKQIVIDRIHQQAAHP